jgi:hypothetical protein
MKLSKRTTDDLLTLIEHTRADISFDGGGTFNLGDDDNTHDAKSAKKAERAIDFIKRLILEGV